MEMEKVMLRYQSINNPMMKESVRSIRNRLLADDNNVVFCFSSLNPKEGVTTITGMLALCLSDIQRSVIVVSTDLKHKNDDFISSKSTLKDYLSGDCNLNSIVNNVNEHFDLIIGSDSDEDYSDLLYLETFKNLLVQLKSEYDVVLIDAPSFSTASEATIISKLADSLVLVVKENSIKMEDFRDFYRRIQKESITIKGVIINQVTESENLEIAVI